MGRDCRPPRERTANANTILRLVHTWLHVRAADSFRESVHPYINRPPEGTLLFLELLLERLIRNEEGISSERFRGERERGIDLSSRRDFSCIHGFSLSYRKVGIRKTRKISFQARVPLRSNTTILETTSELHAAAIWMPLNRSIRNDLHLFIIILHLPKMFSPVYRVQNSCNRPHTSERFGEKGSRRTNRTNYTLMWMETSINV